MTTFIAVYRGTTLNDARLLALSSNPTIVFEFIDRLITTQEKRESDPAFTALSKGRKRALKIAQSELNSN